MSEIFRPGSGRAQANARGLVGQSRVARTLVRRAGGGRAGEPGRSGSCFLRLDQADMGARAPMYQQAPDCSRSPRLENYARARSMPPLSVAAGYQTKPGGGKNWRAERELSGMPTARQDGGFAVIQGRPGGFRASRRLASRCRLPGRELLLDQGRSVPGCAFGSERSRHCSAWGQIGQCTWVVAW